MKAVKKTKEFTIFEKRSGRFAVRNADKKWVNGQDKVSILLKHKLIKVTPPKAKEEPVVETPATSEAPAQEVTPETPAS